MHQDIKQALLFYDKIIGKRVRCYKAMLDIIANFVISSNQKNLRVIDLGCGTSTLEKMILQQRVDIKFVCVDYSKEMLDFSAKKLAGFGAQFLQLDLAKNQQFADNQKADFIISNLVFHSLAEGVKQKVFKAVFETLKKDGLFIFGDKFSSVFKPINELFVETSAKWSSELKQNWTIQEHKKYETIWKLYPEEREFLLTTEEYCKLLKNTGFQSPDCIYRMYQYGILYAKK